LARQRLGLGGVQLDRRRPHAAQFEQDVKRLQILQPQIIDQGGETNHRNHLAFRAQPQLPNIVLPYRT